MTNPEFKDPYDHWPREAKVRLQAWASPEVHAFLSAICPRQGTIQTVINLLLEGLIKDCKSYGIHNYTHADEFRALVLRRARTITAPRPSNTLPAGSTAGVADHWPGVEAAPRDDAGGKASVCPPAAGSTDSGSPNPSGDGSRRTRKSKPSKGTKKGS